MAAPQNFGLTEIRKYSSIPYNWWNKLTLLLYSQRPRSCYCHQALLCAPQLVLKNFGYEEAFRASPYTAFLYNINQHPTIVRLKQFYSKNLNYKLWNPPKINPSVSWKRTWDFLWFFSSQWLFLFLKLDTKEK